MKAMKYINYIIGILGIISIIACLINGAVMDAVAVLIALCLYASITSLRYRKLKYGWEIYSVYRTNDDAHVIKWEKRIH